MLFSTSIAENILYGIDDPDNYDIETIANVAEKANAWSFISSFPDGLQTMVGERGQTLSGQFVSACHRIPLTSLLS